MPVLAMTATATHELLQELAVSLKMAAPLLITAPGCRQNLLYEVRQPSVAMIVRVSVQHQP